MSDAMVPLSPGVRESEGCVSVIRRALLAWHRRGREQRLRRDLAQHELVVAEPRRRDRGDHPRPFEPPPGSKPCHRSCGSGLSQASTGSAPDSTLVAT